MPYPKKKYRKGYIIWDESDLAREIRMGNWIYFKGRPKHPGFIANMTFQVIMGGINAKQFIYAIDQQKEYYGEGVKPYMGREK